MTDEELSVGQLPAFDRGERHEGPRRLLLVEDSTTLQKLIKNCLAMSKIQVTIAGNGLEAVDLVERAGGTFEMILMDVVMPEMNGVEATYRLRANGYTGKIVILTAADTTFDMAASLCAGADDFLAKPFAPADLHRVIAAHCPGYKPAPVAA